MLSIKAKPLLLGECIGASVGSHRFDVFIRLDLLLNRLKVCKQAAEPRLST